MAAIDLANPSNNIMATADDAEAATPSDDTDLVYVSRALYVGTGGDVTVVTKRGNTVLFANVIDGTIIPIRVTRVMATGTTATDILSLY